jgi:ferric-dicitrate binding protein FerR (iron transport regulator)
LSKNLHIEDDLLVKYLLEETSKQEITEVENWLAASEENQQYYNQLKTIWDESKTLDIAIPINEEEAWMRLKSKMIQPKRTVFRMMTFAAAASVLLMIGLFLFFNQNNKNANEVVVHDVENVNKQKVIYTDKMTLIDTLSDLSIVTLNKHTELKAPSVFDGLERRVSLKGEAFFSITPNKEKPFIIETQNQVEIKVLGTSFNVKSYNAYTEVVVETGTVQLKKFNKVILLHPNERARINNDDSTIIVIKSKDKLYKYYRSKQFECDNTPLWKVVEVLNEAYEDSIVIENNELKKLTLTTQFNNESLESVLEVLSETFEFHVEKKGKKYILK